VGVYAVVGLTILAAGGAGWWAFASLSRPTLAEAGPHAIDKAPAPRPKASQPSTAVPDPAAIRRQREQEAELERQREAVRAESEKLARKNELLRRLGEVDAAERRQVENLLATIASLRAFLPQAEAAVLQRRGIVADLQVDVQLGRAFGVPRMPGIGNTREAALAMHLQQLRAEEGALADAKARLAQAEADLKRTRDEAENERSRIRRELER
jgi:hypothetical protein